MPIFEYECVKCGERFEEFHHSGDSNRAKDNELKCPVCGALNPQRVYSTFATCSGCSSSSSVPDTGYVSSG
jgi:putative FmdB family regulatory protein